MYDLTEMETSNDGVFTEENWIPSWRGGETVRSLSVKHSLMRISTGITVLYVSLGQCNILDNILDNNMVTTYAIKEGVHVSPSLYAEKLILRLFEINYFSSLN